MSEGNAKGNEKKTRVKAEKMSTGMETSTAVKTGEDELPTIRGRMVATDVFVSDLWKQIHEDLDNEIAGALRIGENLIKIRDKTKPRGLWLKELEKHGMSQPQASRYIRFAEMPERDRVAFQRVKGFSLSAAVGERRKDKKDAPQKVGDVGGAIQITQTPTNEIQIPVDERADRLAEIDRRLKLAIKMIEAGETALAGEPQPPEYADDTERWRRKLSEVATDVLTVISEGLEAELKKRLLPGLE